MARVSPPYKGEGENYPENYMPISVLSILFKILERLLYDDLRNSFP